MLYPLTFHPIFKERIWGGRNLERLYGKALPPGAPIGESWEVSDRPGNESVIANGPLACRNLHWLMENYRPIITDVLSSVAGVELVVNFTISEDGGSSALHGQLPNNRRRLISHYA